MIKTVLREYPKVTVEEDFNDKRIRDYLTRHYIPHKQGVDMVNLTLDKLDAMLLARGSEIITVEQLKKTIWQAIDLAEICYREKGDN